MLSCIACRAVQQKPSSSRQSPIASGARAERSSRAAAVARRSTGPTSRPFSCIPRHALAAETAATGLSAEPGLPALTVHTSLAALAPPSLPHPLSLLPPAPSRTMAPSIRSFRGSRPPNSYKDPQLSPTLSATSIGTSASQLRADFGDEGGPKVIVTRADVSSSLRERLGALGAVDGRPDELPVHSSASRSRPTRASSRRPRRTAMRSLRSLLPRPH